MTQYLLSALEPHDNSGKQLTGYSELNTEHNSVTVLEQGKVLITF